MDFARWSVGSVAVVVFLVACGEAPERLNVGFEDEVGPYTVSAQASYTPGAAGVVPVLSAQALGAPTLTLELRNYSSAGTGARSRGVVTLAWPNADATLSGTVRLGLERADGTLLASFGTVDAKGSATFTTPYVHQPDERMCVTVEAGLRASKPLGDQMELALQQRVCEETAPTSQQDILVASWTVEQVGVRTTAELRYLAGVGHRTLVRYEAPETATVSGKLCLHEEGKATCNRSSSVTASFAGGGVAEFVTGYYAPADPPLCAGVLGVGACASGSVELLKHHSFDGGVNTNVVLLGTPEGVVGRATVSVPEGVSLHA